MNDGRIGTGSAGEALAARRLQTEGYIILTTRWRCAIGEIDIVARHNGELVFVEVRTRHNADLGSGFESVGKAKRRQLVRTAHMYLTLNHLENAAWRIDVVEVIFRPGKPVSVEIVENAVGW